jgi:hypothetical protein
VLAATSGLACGGGAGGDDAGLDRGGIPDRLGGEERLGGSMQGMLVAPAVTAKAVLTGTGTGLLLDPSVDAATNARAVRDGAAQALVVPECSGRPTVTGNTVTVVFDDLCDHIPGEGVHVTGTVEIVVSVDDVAGSVTALFSFTDLSVEGYPPVDGTASVTVTTGGATSASFSVDATQDTAVLSFDGTVVVAGLDVVVDGEGTFTSGPVRYQITVTGVTWSVTDCYPDAGTVTLSIGPVEETLTFSAETEAFGQAELSRGGSTETITLPPYGSCP